MTQPEVIQGHYVERRPIVVCFFGSIACHSRLMCFGVFHMSVIFKILSLSELLFMFKIKVSGGLKLIFRFGDDRGDLEKIVRHL